MQSDAPFPYQGPQALRQALVDALTRVVDPEMALNIVDLGLVDGITVVDDRCLVRMTMTSAACPVTDLIVEDVERELRRVTPEALQIEIELLWDPPWTADRMSAHARRFMGW